MKKKALLVTLLLVAVIALAACNRDNNGGGTADPTPAQPEQAIPADTTPATTETPADEPEQDVPAHDLGGREVVIGNWWGNWCVDTAEPTTLAAEARLEDRIYVMERYNFTMREENLGGWGYIQEMVTMSILAGDPVADIIILDQAWLMPLLSQGLLAPITSVDFRDTSVYNWNQNIIDMTRDAHDVPHGWTREIQTGGGVWFNMRLLEEAGIDPYLPFDLQMSGQWTWDAWLDMLHALTRDINNDGIMDTWGIATFSQDILGLALPSNNARSVYRDAQGVFHNQTNTPEFLEVLTFVNSLQHIENVQMPQPPDSEWNWFDQAFTNSQVAMRTGGSFGPGGLFDMTDPVGFVTFPVGPSGDTQRFQANANFFVIPGTFGSQDVEEIMQAYMLWQRPLPGFDDPDGWKASEYLRHSTPRSVDETLALFSRDGSRFEPLWWPLLPGQGFSQSQLIAWRMWHEDSDPAAIIEEAQPVINEAIADANRVAGN